MSVIRWNILWTNVMFTTEWWHCDGLSFLEVLRKIIRDPSIYVVLWKWKKKDILIVRRKKFTEYRYEGKSFKYVFLHSFWLIFMQNYWWSLGVEFFKVVLASLCVTWGCLWELKLPSAFKTLRGGAAPFLYVSQLKINQEQW